ncbi:hypothetical protein [Nocardioides mesophilus]|uniref:DUF2510 domain-containing protein n=1 Tax=Nocardioides mesophilus TaxID=433659 RepID=A0A7G9RC08_9ACTN|nr:hypothetical protein [Nocardioides mesophilus]QNN53133.1 hypothetical protein H9L09_01125 [Nocardioides mesophilus]
MTDPQQLPAGPQYSSDGQWWWDGQQWLPANLAAAPQPQHAPGNRRLLIVLALVVVGVVLLGFLAVLGTLSIGSQHDTDEVDNYCQVFPEDC